MKQILIPFLGLFVFSLTGNAQTVKPANVYPTNLEENMYYEKYDARTGTVSGIYFLVLSDGNNSQDVTPAFEVSLYLLPVGSTSAEDAIIGRVYELPGLYHMGSREYKGETLDLNSIEGLKEGNYRLGIWVNSNKAFEENPNDNAMLFKGELSFKPAVQAVKTTEEKKEQTPVEEKVDQEKTTDENWEVEFTPKIKAPKVAKKKKKK